MGKEIKKYLWKKGITDELSAPHTPQQNGVAEHYNHIRKTAGGWYK
jgi:transposase InsO family protein